MSRGVGLGWRGWLLALLLIGVVEDFYVCLWLTVWLSVFERVWCGGGVCDTTVFSFFWFCFVGLEHWCACVCVERRQASGWFAAYPFFLLCLFLAPGGDWDG